MGRQKGARAISLEAEPRAFKQLRSQKTYQALLDAAQTVFARRGFDGAQTPEIAACAGVSTGAFYRYFTDKRACFVEMVTQNLKRAHREIAEKLAPALFEGGDPRRAIDAAIAVLFEHVERDAELGRVYLGMSLSDPDVAALRTEYERRGLDALTELVRAIAPREIAAHPRATALVIQIAAMDAACERAGLRPRLDERVTDGEVKNALAEMILRYLFPESAARPSVASARATTGRSGKRAIEAGSSSRRGG